MRSNHPSYTHQALAVERLLGGPTALFMDMGTGKSKTILDAWVKYNERGTVDLVLIYPAAIRNSWLTQIETHVSGDYWHLVWYDGKWHTLKKGSNDNCPFIYMINVEAWSHPQALMVSPLKAFGDKFVVVDESSTIKNSKAKRTKNITEFFKSAKYKTVMTGTEISNTILDLYAQFAFIDTKILNEKNYYSFENRYAVKRDMLINGRRFSKVIGFTRIDELMGKIAPYVYRVTRDECLDLPGWQDVHVPIEPSPEQRRTYNALKRELQGILDSGAVIDAVSAIALFTKLRQVSGPGVQTPEGYASFGSDPKTEYLVSELEDTSEKVVIFCEYRHEVEAVARAIGERALVYMGGSDGGVIEQFSKDKEKQFFVATSASGGLGLNLQCAALMYFYSVGPSYVIHEQARARIYRSGQTRKCVYKYLLSTPMDKHVLELVANKKDLHEAVREGAESVKRLLEGVPRP